MLCCTNALRVNTFKKMPIESKHNLLHIARFTNITFVLLPTKYIKFKKYYLLKSTPIITSSVLFWILAAVYSILVGKVGNKKSKSTEPGLSHSTSMVKVDRLLS